ncbi:MAG: cupin [Pseudonocardia sp. SCN 72-86]|nr:MAG: cupin [Pseudonocardia sp. SCN 72-86]
MTTPAVSLTDLADAQLTTAKAVPAGRSAHTVHGGGGSVLRQTVLALAAGHSLAEHDSPGEATLQVLRGRVALGTAAGPVTGRAGDLLVIPPDRHDLRAVEDSAVLLTVVPRPA